MFAHQVMKLAGALERFAKEFPDSDIYMVPHVPLPPESMKDDLGSLFFYAMGYYRFLEGFSK